MQTVNLAQKFSLFSDYWNPRVIGEVNDTAVKAVKFTGEFVWHHHDSEDELFLVTSGTLRMRLRENGSEREELVRAGEFIIIPHGVEHCPVAEDEVHCVLFEPKSTLNTGNLRNERTREKLDRL
jgi:mannose-6-phosphate isomerase-like protein (cupin superfamily)